MYSSISFSNWQAKKRVGKFDVRLEIILGGFLIRQTGHKQLACNDVTNLAAQDLSGLSHVCLKLFWPSGHFFLSKL